MLRTPHQSQFSIISVNRQLLWSRTSDETWMLNPPHRYVINGDHVKPIADYIDTLSDLTTSTNYRPLNGKANLVKRRVLVERCRDRGIGDLLFLTGVFAYLQSINSYDTQIHVSALTDRGQCLAANPHIFQGGLRYGPIQYNDLLDFDYHWFIDNVSEHSEEADQENVYDILYKSIGVEPTSVSPEYKRPRVTLTTDDMVNLDSTYFYIAQDRKIDLRRTPYYVVAPLTNSTLRSAPYRLWLDVIDELAKQRPVLVVGRINEGKMPSTDMPFGAFFKEIADNNNPAVINLMGETPLRIVMSLIGKSLLTVGLDSGPLYIAQALRVPAISLWGTHDPMVRIGYDPAYMDLAVWPKATCRCSPCFAYQYFPHTKCPDKSRQTVCEVLKSITAGQIMAKVAKVEERFAKNIVNV